MALALAGLALPAGSVPAAGSQPGGDRPGTPLVRIPFPQDDGTLTPYTFELGYPLVTLVYDTLMWRDADGVPQPWLARSVDVSRDGLTVTIGLHEGVRWHDGAPLTAADVAFTFDFVARRPHDRFTPQLRAVQRVTAPDAATVVVRLAHPSLGFADQPLADLPILPAHLWRGLAPGRPAPDGLAVGSGPYRLVDHRPGEGYSFEANDDYFRGRPAVASIEVPVIGEAQATFDALRRNEVDMVPVSLPAGVVPAVEGLATRIVRGPSYLGTVLLFNLRQVPFDRLEVRRAVARALDLRSIARAVGAAVPAEQGYLHPASNWSPDEALHVFDEEAARRALGELGLPAVEVLVADNDPVKLEAARQVANALRRVGLEATSTPLPRQEVARAMGRHGDPPTFGLAIGVTSPLASYDPDFLRRTFGAEGVAVNVTGYRSADFDRAAAAVATAADVAARRAAVGEALRLLADDVPVVPLFFSDGAYAYRPSAYDGWVLIKGSGILDKRSFVEPGPVARRPRAPVTPSPTPGRSPLGYLALAPLVLAAVVAAVALARRAR